MAWTMLKSGVQKNGKWYCGEYPTGWYVWNASGETKGPFKTFELACKGAIQK